MVSFLCVSKSLTLIITFRHVYASDSGIPDYRSPGRVVATPMTYARFLSAHSQRQRYWARSFLGYPLISSAQPNDSHRIVAQWQSQGRLRHLITQNVDSLHLKAGNTDVTELHGSLADVICLQCKTVSSRADIQAKFHELNGDWIRDLDQSLRDRLVKGTLGDRAMRDRQATAATLPTAAPAQEHAATVAGTNTAAESSVLQMKPDGDIELQDTAGFIVPPCDLCGGILKPRVVFFGENVASDIVKRAVEHVRAADLLLVLGSSLHVWSGRRFVNAAVEQRIPVAIVNMGPTKSDDQATVKVNARIADVLRMLPASSASTFSSDTHQLSSAHASSVG